MRRISLILATLGLAVAALPAAAQDRTGSWEISPFAGGYFGGTLYNNVPPAGQPAGQGASGAYAPLYSGHIDVSTDVAYGVRVGYNVNRWLGIEVDWTHARPDLTTRVFAQTAIGASTPSFESRTRVGRLTQDVYEANALFNWGKRKVIGYFGLGAGASVMKTDLPSAPAPPGGPPSPIAVVGSSSSTRFTGSSFVGGKFFFTPHVGVRVDGRYRFTDMGRNSTRYTSCDSYGCYYYRSSWYSSGELTGGLTFAF